METIRTYIDQMFRDLPKSKEVVEMKLNILDHMEEKFNELIREGKAEAEASRMVINEFGDMNEILRELDIEQAEMETDINYLTNSEVDEFINWRGKFSIAMAIGVVICINAIAITALISELVSKKMEDIFVVIPFFSLIAVAVIIFISFGILDSKYSEMVKQPVIDAQKRQEIRTKMDGYRIPFMIMITVGVVLCIMAVALFPLFKYLYNEAFAAFMFFEIISIGVFLFIFAGIREDRYQIFLKTKKNSKKSARDEAISGVIMLSATAIFLFIGFVFGIWHPTWVVFLIGGIMCGIVETFRSGRED